MIAQALVDGIADGTLALSESDSEGELEEQDEDTSKQDPIVSCIL